MIELSKQILNYQYLLMKLLIVEDDIDLKESLKMSLEGESFTVDTAPDGEKGSYRARSNNYDVIILDAMLPKKDGLEMCKEVRESKCNTPILILTALSEMKDKLSLLNAGADDYMTKPFSFEELVARLHALSRRPGNIEEDSIKVGNLIIDTKKQKVVRGKKEIYLTRKEFSLIEYLAKNKNMVVSRGMIMEHVWNRDSDPFSNTIESHILNLRKKIDSGRKRKMIQNIPGRGYRLESRGKKYNNND
jgi:DNA-binding response OmpR family regulator